MREYKRFLVLPLIIIFLFSAVGGSSFGKGEIFNQDSTSTALFQVSLPEFFSTKLSVLVPIDGLCLLLESKQEYVSKSTAESDRGNYSEPSVELNQEYVPQSTVVPKQEICCELPQTTELLSTNESEKPVLLPGPTLSPKLTPSPEPTLFPEPTSFTEPTLSPESSPSPMVTSTPEQTPSEKENKGNKKVKKAKKAKKEKGNSGNHYGNQESQQDNGSKEKKEQDNNRDGNKEKKEKNKK